MTPTCSKFAAESFVKLEVVKAADIDGAGQLHVLLRLAPAAIQQDRRGGHAGRRGRLLAPAHLGQVFMASSIWERATSSAAFTAFGRPPGLPLWPFKKGIQIQRVASVGGSSALGPTRVPGHAIRTYSGRPRSSMRLSTFAAM